MRWWRPGEQRRQLAVENYATSLEQEVQARTSELIEEKKKGDALLYSMLVGAIKSAQNEAHGLQPPQVVDRLKLGQKVDPEHFESCTVFFRYASRKCRSRRKNILHLAMWSRLLGSPPCAHPFRFPSSQPRCSATGCILGCKPSKQHLHKLRSNHLSTRRV